MRWIILGILAVALVFVVRKLMGGGGSRKRDSGSPPVDLASLTIRDVRRGDIVSLANSSPEYDDLAVTIDKIHRYEFGRDQWYEAEGHSPHGRVAVEWYDDDGLQIYYTYLKGHRIEELGLTEDDLIRFDQEQSSANSIEFEGSTFRFDSSHETGFFEDGRGEGEGFYCWNFESDGGRALSIEKWEGEAFEFFVSRLIRPEEVDIFRA